MSLRFFCGFDALDTDALTAMFTSVEATVAVDPTGGRNGGAAAFCDNIARGFTKTLDAQATWIVGMAFRVEAFPNNASTIITLRDLGSTQVDLRLNPDGTLSVTRNGTGLTNGTSSFAINAGEWYYIEFKATIANSISAGSCKVRVNGVDRITVATGQDIQATANATANSVKFCDAVAAFVSNWWIDDLYICDGQGSVNNDFLGNIMAQVIYPTGAGTTTEWDPSAGANWENVDDATPDDDSTYNSTDTAGDIDTYAMGDMSSTPSTIHGIQWNCLARITDSDDYVLRRVVRSGATDYEGSTDHAPGSSYTYAHEVLEEDPDTSAAWDEAGINALEAGVKLQSVT